MTASTPPQEVASMSTRNPDEPQGHRGHPTEREVRRARKLQPLLARAVHHLEAQGFGYGEAIAFIAGIAHDKAADLGETWSVEYNAISTIDGILAGRAAKEWSIQALILALYEVGSLLREPER